MSWREMQLGDAIHIKHGFAFKGEFFADAGDHVVLTPGNFNEAGGFRRRPEKDKAYVGDIPDGYVLSEGALIVAMTEQGPGLLGSSALVPEGGRYLHNQRLGLVDSIDVAQLDKRFLYYLFNTHSVRGQIRGSASGTKVRHTAPDRIYRVRVKVPDVKTQRAIGELLAAYDDLIENNCRRMALLEEAARQLYREWFVRLRFPGHEHTRIIDGVPEGWEDVSASGILEINPKEKIEKGTVATYVPMSSLSESEMTVERGDFEERTKHTSIKFRNEDTLFARITPSLENGKTGFVDFLGEDEIACGSTEIIVLRGAAVSPYFTYCLARTYDFRENAIKSMIGSSGRQRVQNSCFDKFRLPLPPRVLREEFDRTAEPCFQQIKNLADQNHRLRAARDLLLPRLMSGEIAV